MTDMHNFSNLKNRAINELLDMNNRATQSKENTHKTAAQRACKHTKNPLDSFGFTFSSDDIIIVGLMLILADDCRDIWLFLALLYILM